MTPIVCNYAAIRFRPHPENGEFANIGVAAQFPDRRFFAYRIMPRMSRRLRAFFPEIDAKVFRGAVEATTHELRYFTQEGLFDRKTCLRHDIARSPVAFDLAMRSREGIIHFSSIRTRLFQTPATEVVNQLYKELIDRVYDVSDEGRDRVRREVRRLLKAHHYDDYFDKNVAIGNTEYHVQFPFVQFVAGRPVKAIKPIDLNKPDAKSVYDHADYWLPRLLRLAQRQAIPDELIFPVDMPRVPAAFKAAEEVFSELRSLKANPVSMNDRAALLDVLRPLGFDDHNNN